MVRFGLFEGDEFFGGSVERKDIESFKRRLGRFALTERKQELSDVGSCSMR